LHAFKNQEEYRNELLHGCGCAFMDGTASQSAPIVKIGTEKTKTGAQDEIEQSPSRPGEAATG
jgi:hypothetical protein